MSTAKLSCTDSGEGRPVLFVHGYPLDHTMWSAQISELSRNHRVLAPDLRGFGASPLGEADPDTGISMDDYADDLAHLLDVARVKEPIVYCGFSMGGYIGWCFIKKYRSKLAALVLCDTRAAADSGEVREKRLETAQQVNDHGSAWIAEQMIPKLFAETTRRERPEIVDRMAEVIRRTNPDSIAAALRGMANRPDSTPMLSMLDLPTLLIVGENDVITTKDEMSSLAKVIPNSEFIVASNAGHMAPVENPAAVTKAMSDFLSRL